MLRIKPRAAEWETSMLPLCYADPKSIAWSSNSFQQSYSTVPGPLVPLLGATPLGLVHEKVGENVAGKSWTTRPSITSTTRMKSTRHVAEPNFTDADAFCKNRPVFRFLNRNRIPLIGPKLAKTFGNFWGPTSILYLNFPFGHLKLYKFFYQAQCFQWL